MVSFNKMCSLLAVIIVLGGAIAVLSIRAQTKASPGTRVTGTGCVKAGVEGGCLILRDFKTKKLYNLFFKTPTQPALDTVVSFEGTVHEGPTMCMQGTAVDVTKWTQLKMKCPSEENKSITKVGRKMAKNLKGKCSKWTAWHDFQPGGVPTLYVTATCVFPTTGYSVKLEPAVPPGINPTIYNMNRIVHAPTDPVEDVITEAKIDYQEKTSVHYKTIFILVDNVSIPVKEVSR